MSTNVATIRTRIEDITGRTEIANSDMELFFINAAMRLIQRKDIFRIGGSTASLTSPAISNGAVGNMTFSTTATATIGGGFPSSFRSYRDLVQTTPSNKSAFTKMTWEYANRIWRAAETLSSSNADIFQGVVVEGNNLYLQPRYVATSAFNAGAWAFTLFYEEWLTDLTSDSDSNYITDTAPDLLVYLASCFVLTYLREIDDAGNMLNIANRMINDFSKTEYQATNAGKNIKLGDIQEIAMTINKKQLEQ